MEERDVVYMAMGSRVILLLVMAIWLAICNPYDTSAALDLPCLPKNPDSHLHSHSFHQNPHSDPIWNSGIARSVVWDGVYFLRIARCGYEYEQMYAFQPLLPLLMRFLSSTFLRVLLPLLGYNQTLALAGYIINFVAFIFAAVYLYRLGLIILEDKNMAYISTAFFCFNPASVFYSSIYTESLFALFTFAGMYYFVRGLTWKSAFSFGFSIITRANGILHIGFFCYQVLHSIIRKPMSAGIFRTVLQVGCVLVPFIAFQGYGYYEICGNASNPRPWCTARVPSLYNFVQSHYWNVGFLRYFEVKQIPNFFSASPAILLASFAVYKFAKGQPELFFTAGMATEQKVTCKGFLAPANVPFVLQLLAMTFIAFFVMHVQVSTRFLSSSPVVYWFAAHIHKQSKKASYIIWSVFLAYIFVGTLLFTNFYPFT